MRAILLGVWQSILNPGVLMASPRLSTLISLGHFHYQLRKAVRGIDLEKVVLVWESTVPAMFPLVRSLARRGARVIAFPHNIEALSAAKKNRRLMIGWLRRELSVLALAEEVVCISNTDSWFYSNFGIMTSTWPYMPEVEELEAQYRIKRSRLHSRKDTVLIVGTSKNVSTRTGILELLQSNSKTQPSHRVALVSSGFTLPAGARYPNVAIYPDLPADQFEKELERAIAIVIFQPWGTGLLTRVQEAHNMGIPIFGNEVAGRGYGLRADSVPKLVSGTFPGLEFFEIIPQSYNQSVRTARLISRIDELENFSK